MRPNQKPLEFVTDSTGCMRCVSHVPSGCGYSVLRINGKMKRLHRVVYQIVKGEIPPGKMIRHTCDNKLCVNPDHLLIGTHKENMVDMVERQRSLRGKKNHNVKLNIQQVLEIKSLKGKESCSVVGKKFKVHQTTIHYIWKGKLWGWLGENNCR